MTLLKIKHWIKFHTAIPKETDKGLNIPEKDMIGAIVTLINDPHQEEYEVVTSGPMSRGPIRQFSAVISFLCRRKMKNGYYDYNWFRKDSLKFIR